MATQSDMMTKVAEDVLKEIQKYAPNEYARLVEDQTTKEKILQAAKATAEETFTLNEEFKGQPKDIAKRLAKHLPNGRVKLIQGGLSIPTFKMTIIRKDEVKFLVEFTRDGQEFQPTLSLKTKADVRSCYVEQCASILIEAVLLVMSAVGISVPPGTNLIRRLVPKIASELRSSPLLRAGLDGFVEAWNRAARDPFKLARALFDLISRSNRAGIFWTTVESLCSDMAWYDWMETFAKVCALIIASLASDGAALIAEIVLIVLSALDFFRKIANLVQLSDIEKFL